MLNKLMPCLLLIFSPSDFLIQVIDRNSHSLWQIVQIQISWLLKKPTDLDLHCLQRQGISGFSRTRVKKVSNYLGSSCSISGRGNLPVTMSISPWPNFLSSMTMVRFVAPLFFSNYMAYGQEMGNCYTLQEESWKQSSVCYLPTFTFKWF